MFSSSIIAATAISLATLITTTHATAAESINGFTVIWQDDFTGTELDMSNWSYFTGVPSNGEEETYPVGGPNCQLSGQGSLLITPEYANGKWTSCRIESVPSFATVPGKQMVVQSRFKLGTPGAELQGIWPAFWSLGNSMREGTSWPSCGEIDTFENINGGALGYGTLHCGSQCNDPDGLSAGIAFDYGNYHTWAHAIDLRESDYTQQSITWYMDGQSYHVIYGSDIGDETVWAAVAQSAMYMILNVAVGGGWPGSAAANTVSGSAAGMEVLYVGVYHSN